MDWLGRLASPRNPPVSVSPTLVLLVCVPPFLNCYVVPGIETQLLTPMWQALCRLSHSQPGHLLLTFYRASAEINCTSWYYFVHVVTGVTSINNKNGFTQKLFLVSILTAFSGHQPYPLPHKGKHFSDFCSPTSMLPAHDSPKENLAICTFDCLFQNSKTWDAFHDIQESEIKK